MKNKYGIGFFVTVMLLMLLLNLGFQTGYRRARQKAEARIQIAEETQAEYKHAISTEGQAREEKGFVLKEEHGYVVVYLSDRKTVFEYTDLSCDEFPDSLQEELKRGKVIQTSEELYGFLENYSS